jgi:hypothetical protein
MDKHIASLIHKLRVECVRALADKIKNPQAAFSNSAENAIKTITELLGSEKSIH